MVRNDDRKANLISYNVIEFEMGRLTENIGKKSNGNAHAYAHRIQIYPKWPTEILVSLWMTLNQNLVTRQRNMTKENASTKEKY